MQSIAMDENKQIDGRATSGNRMFLPAVGRGGAVNSLTSEENMAETSLFERRQAIFARVVAMLNARGTPITDDPRFIQLVDEWASGKIELDDLTRGYFAIRHVGRELPAGRQGSETPGARSEGLSQEKLLGELERIIGIYEPDEPRPD
jgi:hypothetical protein